MQEMDPNACSPTSSPLKRREPASAPSPSQIHKQYWGGVAKRAAAAKPPRSPLPSSAAGGKNQPGTLSPRRGGSPMNVKVPTKSPLQGMAANVVKAAHTNPLFSEAQLTPKAPGWKSITKAEHASKENSTPADASPRPTTTFGKPISRIPKPPATSTAIPLTNPTDELVTIPLTPEKTTKANTATATKAETVIDITQEVKNRVNYAQNTPPNTPVIEDAQTALPESGVSDNPQYSPSNNPFSPRPEYRRTSIARGATPGRTSLVTQPDWSSLLSTPPKGSPDGADDLITPPRTTANAFPVSGGSPQFIEVFLPQLGSERATPRRRLRLAPENNVTSETLPSEPDSPGIPRPRSRVRLILKLLLATVVFLSLGQIAVPPGWIPQELRGAALLSGVSPRGQWQEVPGVEKYKGNAWFSSTLFADSDGAASLQRNLYETPKDKDDITWKQERPVTLPRAEEAAAVTGPALPVIHLEFDEYDGADNLEEIVPEDQPDHSVEPTDHDASQWQELSDFDSADVSTENEPGADVSMGNGHVSSFERESESFVPATKTDDEAAVVSDAKPTVTDDKPRVKDTKPAVKDPKPAGSDAKPTVSDAKPSVYETQQREAALLEMADLAVRSYTSAFLAALALFGVFSFTAYVAAHFLPPMVGGDVAVNGDNVAADGGDVADDVRGETAGAPEITTPMFLRQGARMEDPVVVSPRGVNAGSPFGRYHAFVRQMTGQNTEAPQLTLTPVQRSRRLADKFRAVAGSPSRRFALSPA